MPRFVATALAGVAAAGMAVLGTVGIDAGALERPAYATTPQARPTASPVAAPLGGLPVGGAPVRADSVRDDQWQLRKLDIAAAWRQSTGAGVTVAVIDSGVDAGHADLAGQVLPGTDLVAGSGDGRADPVGHGTTVAGIIAGRKDDSRGVVGIAPDAKILPIRVLDKDNRYDDAMIVAKAVRWAVDHGARVVNLSLGGTGTSPVLAAALDYAFAKDVVVVACTGNISPAGPSEVWYPAREPGVLAVTGLDRDDDLWSGAITGAQTVIAAPATGLLGARPNGYWRVQGTSFAAPMVAATAALIRSRWPDMSAANVISRIVSTARDVGAAGRDDRFGFGMVDPNRALTADVATTTGNPLDTAPPPGVAGFGAAPGADETPGSSLQPRTQIDGALARRPNPGSGAQPAGPARPERDHGWVGITAYVVLAGLGSLTIVRRFGPRRR